MVEAKFVFGGLEAVLDGPTVPFDPDESLDVGSRRAPSGEEGEIANGDATPDQQAAGPQPGSATLGVMTKEPGGGRSTSYALAQQELISRCRGKTSRLYRQQIRAHLSQDFGYK